MTLADIAAMDKPTIGTKEAAQATGHDRYTINVCKKKGLKWMGIELHYTGQKDGKVVMKRLEFLKEMGWEGPA